MANKEVNESQFYVIHFVQKPFRKIDHYVCIPHNWAVYKYADKKMVVAYPKREDCIVTRERAKKKEKPKEEWKFCLAALKYQTDSYNDAERWISEKNKYRRLFEAEDSSPNDTRQKVRRDQESLRSNQEYSSKPRDKSERVRVKPYEIPQKPSLKDTDKISSNESKKQIFLKQLKLSTTETAKSTVETIDPQPECSTSEQSTVISDKQLKRNKSEKTAAANGPKNTEGNFQSSKQNNHKLRKPDSSLPVPNLEGCNEVINSKGHSQQEQLRETKGSQNQPASNSIGAPKVPSSVKQITQPNQHNNQKLRVTDDRTLTAPSSSNQKPRVANQIENPQKNMPITLQKPLNLIDPIKPLPPLPLRPSVSIQQPSTVNIQSPGHQGPSVLNKINGTPVGGMTNNFQETQHLPRIIIEPVTEPRVVHTAASVTAPQNIPKSHQHPIIVRQYVQQNLAAPQEFMHQTHRQELPPKPTEYRLDPRLRLENRPMSNLTQHQPIRPSLNNDPTNVPSQFHPPMKIQHHAQKVVSQQNAQQSQSPVYVPILHKNNRKSPTLQGVTKTTKSSTSSRASISINQAILTALESFPMNEQETQAILNRISKEQSNPGLRNVLRNISALQAYDLHRPKMPMSISHQLSRMASPSVHKNLDQYSRMQTQQIDRSDETNLSTERHVQDDTVRSVINQTRVNNIKRQTIPNIQEPSSSNHSAALDSGLDKGHETAFSKEMSVDESHELVNKTNQTEHNSIEESNIQSTSSEVIMLRKISEKFQTDFAQVNSDFLDITTRVDDLQKLFFQFTKLYREFLDSKKINSLENSSHEPSSKITQEVSSVIEKRQAAGSERRNSNNGNRLSNDVIVAPDNRDHPSDSRKNPNSTQQFALPPEYDSNDTKWTLKYQAHMAGLKELVPNTNIYVSYNKLKRIIQRSNCCQLLARLLLHEVFNEKALSVCATITEIVNISANMSPEGRPALNDRGLAVLVGFVKEYASRRTSRCAWCYDIKEIINALDQEVIAMRMKFSGTSRFQCN